MPKPPGVLRTLEDRARSSLIAQRPSAIQATNVHW